uniref:Uncharacterized protein n=1 Tax=Anguilla anguilla TaxID=7936 RepID=A0A0E9RG39_ANGAN
MSVRFSCQLLALMTQLAHNILNYILDWHMNDCFYVSLYE